MYAVKIDSDSQITRLNERLKIRLAPSSIHGVGVFAIRDIEKGQKLYADSVPEIYDVKYTHFGKLFKEVKAILLERFPAIVVGSKFVFPTDRVQAYMNHSDNPNYDAIHDELIRDVQKGEEITEDYRQISGSKQVFPWLYPQGKIEALDKE